MTIACAPGALPATDLPGFLAALEEARFDPDDEAAYLAAAPLLAALGRDRRFLGDLMLAELKARGRRQEEESDYGPQVLLLHRGPGWFVRANFWPEAADPLVRASGPAAFLYGVPHDHNFTFLTCGYWGPGYWSDYYAAEAWAAGAAAGAPAPLRFVERAALGEGMLRLYRAHRDVHDQHPPDASSISLNLAQAGAGRTFLDQYRYDVDRGLIAGQLARTSTEALVALAPALGGDEGMALVEAFARGHPADRVRFGAVVALAAAGGADGRRVLEGAAGGGNRRVAASARAHVAKQEAKVAP